jgi:hypothetical protein
MSYEQFDIYETHRTNLENHAWAIEAHCADAILPPPQGIYCKGILEPIMVDGGEYHIHADISGSTVKVPVNNLDTVGNSPVYRMQGREERVIISGKIMEKKHRFLSTEPSLPYRGLKILHSMVEDYFDDFVAYPRDRTSPKKKKSDRIADFASVTNPRSEKECLCKHFSPVISDEAFEKAAKTIELITKDIFSELAKFRKNYVWNLYTVTIDGCSIKVDMGIDYRAFLHLEQQAKERLIREHSE